MEILQHHEVWKVVWRGDDHKFSHTRIILKDESGFHKATINSREHLFDGDGNSLSTEPIPIEVIWRLYSPGLTVVSEPTPDCYYMKRPDVSFAGDSDKLRPCDLLSAEAMMCEALRQSLHPKIATYFGCIVKDSKAQGLCFQQHSRTLAKKIQGTVESIDKILAGIEAGIVRLHGLGIVHREINKHNIMPLNDGEPVIIDFDASRYLGEKIGPKCAMTREEKDEAVTEIDYYGLDVVRDFLFNALNEASQVQVRQGIASKRDL